MQYPCPARVDRHFLSVLNSSTYALQHFASCAAGAKVSYERGTLMKDVVMPLTRQRLKYGVVIRYSGSVLGTRTEKQTGKKKWAPQADPLQMLPTTSNRGPLRAGYGGRHPIG